MNNMYINLAEDNFSVLHVVALSGRTIETTGPMRVAKELVLGLSAQGIQAEVLAGFLGQASMSEENLNCTLVKVRPLTARFPTSSLTSVDLIRQLYKKINTNHIVHIHFGRDLVSFLSAILCIFLDRPYIVQTHGMVISDPRKFIKIIDIVFTRFLVKRAKRILLLSEQEEKEKRELKLNCQSFILRNGLRTQVSNRDEELITIPRIVFCSRVAPEKGITRFIDLAKMAYQKGIEAEFTVYGPIDDSHGNLAQELHKAQNFCRYGGVLSHETVLNTLQDSDLLILPSTYDPFPMAVLESLSVGTPVLISSLCGNAAALKEHFPDFVVDGRNLEDYWQKFLNLWQLRFYRERRNQIIEVCSAIFGLDTVISNLLRIYQEAMESPV